MAITITNGTSNVKVNLGRKTIWVTKPYRVVHNTDSDRIYIHTDKSPGHKQGFTDIFIDYAQVTSPSTASPAALAEVLVGYNSQSNDGTFVNGDLVANILTIDHQLGSTAVGVTIRDSTGVEVLMSSVVVDNNTVTVDFGGAISGTHTWFVYTN